MRSEKLRSLGVEALDPNRSRLIKIALGIVTDMAGLDADERHQFAGSELERVVIDDETDEADIVYGLMNLALILLVKLEAHGESFDEVLADIGRRY